MSRPPIQVEAREAIAGEPIDLRAWVYRYVSAIARQQGMTEPPRQEAA
jgi:hypothetical protein